ncbi:spore germination protein [Brevibacillus choshinensis]|uniref:Spore germination protein n=1 Tax=Brevibacillus choshinensis TaxID=54911 RepID=A0ABX7FKE2_BRECH|nr:spore germination protein [Brevibacillus choshinensis]QRG66602.1 spore germination protein [Brevibacillus choshinensis]
MIDNEKNRLTTSQAAVIVINFILGSGILTLPRTSVEKVHTPDVWITVILAGFFAMLAGVIIVKLSQRFPQTTFYQYSQEIVGKWLGIACGFLIIGYFIMTSALQVRYMAEVTSFYLLEGTPEWAIIMAFLWVSLYLVTGGMQPIARMFEIILPITVLFFLLVSLLSLKIFEIDYLRPVLGMGIQPVFAGLRTTALSYSGFEIMLILCAFMDTPSKATKAVLVGISIPLVFYLITVVMVVGAFSIDGVVTRTWPTIDLIRSFEMTGILFERFESLLLVLWIMQIFSTFCIAYYAASFGLSQLFGKKIRPFLYGLLPLLYLIAMTPKDLGQVFALGDMVGNASLILFGGLPLCLLIISRWRVKRIDATSSP